MQQASHLAANLDRSSQIRHHADRNAPAPLNPAPPCFVSSFGKISPPDRSRARLPSSAATFALPLGHDAIWTWQPAAGNVHHVFVASFRNRPRQLDTARLTGRFAKRPFSKKSVHRSKLFFAFRRPLKNRLPRKWQKQVRTDAERTQKVCSLAHKVAPIHSPFAPFHTDFASGFMVQFLSN